MKSYQKLDLINNYVEIYKCIFDCKQAIIHSSEESTIKKLSEFYNELINLKTIYEKTFIEKNIMDDSLILLKMQLDSALNNPPNLSKKEYSLEKLISKKKHLESALQNIN